jgi:hypothetical protein
MITFDPGYKRPAADCATGMAYFRKFIQAGQADRKTGPFRIRTLFSQEVSTDGTHGGINKVKELIKNRHRYNALRIGVRSQKPGVRMEPIKHQNNLPPESSGKQS